MKPLADSSLVTSSVHPLGRQAMNVAMVPPIIDVVGVGIGHAAAHGIRKLTFACPASVVIGLCPDSPRTCRLFLDLLAGRLAPESGAYLLAGLDLATLTPAAKRAELARHVGCSMRGDEFLAHWTVVQNVALALTANNAPEAFALERAMAELELLGLASCATLLPRHLTAAQLRLTTIARALVAKPRLVLCEVPEEHLNTRQLAVLRLRLWNAVHVDGACIVMCTNNDSLASLVHTTLAFAKEL